MNQKTCFILVYFIGFLGCTIHSITDISDVEAFNEALKKASAGDTVFLSSGTFKNWEATINVSGMAKPEVIVEKNKFIRCNRESEIISSKSSGNIYRNNQFENCERAIVMCDGHGCEISGNNFQGGFMGVRLSGTRHHVLNNEIKNTGKHAMLDSVLRQIYPPMNNKFISNIITAEKGKRFIIDDAPDNLIENNNIREP